MLVLLHSSMIAWSSSGAILHLLPAFTSVDMTMTMPVCTCKLPTPMKDYYPRTRLLDNSVLTLEINTCQFYTGGLTQGHLELHHMYLSISWLLEALTPFGVHVPTCFTGTTTVYMCACVCVFEQ